MSLNRRQFLSASALLGSAFGFTKEALAQPVDVPAKWDEEYDVVVVGAGGAGLAAACTAVENKASVIVLESQPTIGGSSIICGGAYSAADTYLQREKGIQDNDELFVKDMLKTGGHMNDEALVRTYVKESKAQFEWIVAHGVKPNTVTTASGMSVPRAHGFNPADVINCMAKYAKDNGAKIVLRTTAERLVYDAKSHKIVGVKAKNRSGKTVYYHAKKGVLMAAGGFSRNPDMLAKYAPPLKLAKTITGTGTDGSGIKMMLAYGADMMDTAYIKATYGFKEKPNSIAKDFSIIYYSGAIMVNSDGQRFVDESLSYKLLGDKALLQKDGKSWLVFDEAMRKHAMSTNNWDKVIWAPIDEGKKDLDFVFVGNTIEEAAQKAGLDPKAVAATVKKYNETAPEGRDPLGRTSLSSGFGKPLKIEKGPFYVYPAVPVMIGTYCGVRTNTNAEVLDVFGDRIEGLWAAGELMGGVHGAAYMTGTAFSKAQAFGRIAVRDMLKA